MKPMSETMDDDLRYPTPPESFGIDFGRLNVVAFRRRRVPFAEWSRRMSERFESAGSTAGRDRPLAAGDVRPLVPRKEHQ